MCHFLLLLIGCDSILELIYLSDKKCLDFLKLHDLACAVLAESAGSAVGETTRSAFSRLDLTDIHRGKIVNMKLCWGTVISFRTKVLSGVRHERKSLGSAAPSRVPVDGRPSFPFMR